MNFLGFFSSYGAASVFGLVFAKPQEKGCFKVKQKAVKNGKIKMARMSFPCHFLLIMKIIVYIFGFFMILKLKLSAFKNGFYITDDSLKVFYIATVKNCDLAPIVALFNAFNKALKHFFSHLKG